MDLTVPRPASPCPDPQRYTRLPDALISELAPREHQLVHALLSYRWFDDSPIRPFVATLADRLGCHRRTVQRGLRSLERKGYVVTVARYREDTDHGQTSNDYAPGPMLLPLLPHAGAQDAAPDRRERQAPMTASPSGRKHGNYPKGNRRSEGRSTPPAAAGETVMTRYGPLTTRT